MIADNFTLHAQARVQQRGIPPLVIELLERFGSCVRCCGADRLIFDKAAIARLKRHLGGIAGCASWIAGSMSMPWLVTMVVSSQSPTSTAAFGGTD